MPLSADCLPRLAADLLAPGRFHLAPDLRLAWSHQPTREVPWEIFQGRLLDAALTRQTTAFAWWNVHVVSSTGTHEEPFLSLVLDEPGGQVHVVRAVDAYVQQGYDAGGNVYRTREVRRPVRERVAVLDLADFSSEEELRAELALSLHRAVVGTRLPLTPEESPLPLFSFGRLYLTDLSGPPDASPSLADLLSLLPGVEQPSRLLEAWLRGLSRADLPVAAEELARFWQAEGRCSEDLLATLRRLFQDVSLSPYIDLGERVRDLLAGLERGGLLHPDQVLDFEAHLLRLLGRHLTAYDLVVFHHRGANYPDALLLDDLLADFLDRLERSPSAFAGEEGRLRRRALRQAWVIRRRYEGHPVPDVPTSPGEHQRALPDDYPRVPEEQILQPGTRRRRLYADAPLTARLTSAVQAVLVASWADLERPVERLELGAALFLDRPLGGGKAPVEPDATPLLASLAHSPSIARQRLHLLAKDLGLPSAEVDAMAAHPPPSGVPLERIGPSLRPTTVSLADAARAASDFIFLRTLAGSVAQVRDRLDLRPLEAAGAAWPTGPVLLARSTTGPGLIVHDAEHQPRLELEPCLGEGYRSRQGVEFPVAGCWVVRMDGQPIAPILLPARV